MSDRHVTDEEIHDLSGRAPRVPPGVPHATCLNCGQVHPAFYASHSHDCMLNLAEQRTYAEWLLLFQNWGWGVLKNPSVRKFRDFGQVISGRKMLTEFLQSDIKAGSGYELQAYYTTPEFREAGFVLGVRIA